MSTHSERGGIIKIVKARIAAFEDTPLRDPRLSCKARGIASYLLSKPPGWQIWTGDLIRRSTDGKAAVFAALKELETYGYLTRERLNDERGRIHWRKSMSATPTQMWDEDDAPRPGKPVMAAPPPPCTDFPDMVNREMVPPCTDFPYMEKPDMENRTHSISNCSYSDLKEEREGGETATPSEEGMTATPSGRGETATPSERGETATPSEEGVTATPSEEGAVSYTHLDVYKRQYPGRALPPFVIMASGDTITSRMSSTSSSV